MMTSLIRRFFLIFPLALLLPAIALADRLTDTGNAAMDALQGAINQAAQAAQNRATAAQLENQAKGQDAICAS